MDKCYNTLVMETKVLQKVVGFFDMGNSPTRSQDVWKVGGRTESETVGG